MSASNERAMAGTGCTTGCTAETLIAALCEVDPRAWRDAAIHALHQPGFSAAAQRVDAMRPAIDPARLWGLEDDMESALYRLTTHEGVGVIHGSREYQQVRQVTWCAAVALACDGALDADTLRTVAGQLAALVQAGG